MNRKVNILQSVQALRALAGIVVMFLTTLTASATEFITDVMVIGGTAQEVTIKTSQLKAEGWTRIEYDLNKGCGASSDYIYLLYKSQNSPSNVNDGTFITDFYIKDGKGGSETVNEWLYTDDRTYRLVPYDGSQHFREQQGDLNSGTGSSTNSIHLYYTRDRFSDHRAISEIRFDSEGYDALCSDGVTGMAPFNLNAGCKSGSAEIYMHVGKTTALPFRGAGTKNNPYLIGTNAEWERFATLVNQGLYTNLCYQLDESITITKMVGTIYHPFRGTFDGGENYLTLNISSSDAYAAPFQYVDGATLKNFVVKGWCMGGIHTAGLVGSCAGTVSIKSCKVGANVTTSSSHVGGIVGHGGASTLTIEGCYFNGTINGFTDVAGGILGWCEDATLTMNNCLFKGSFSPGANGRYHPIVCHHPYKNPNATFTATYYMNTLTPTAFYFTENNFKTLSTEYIHGSFESQITAADGQSYYVRTYGLDLPYSYGFENNDLNAEEWKLLNNNVSAIVSDDVYQTEGTYCFRVSLSPQTHYLISPEFKGLNAITMEYNQKREFGSPTYRLGFSKTTDDISSFVWGGMETCSSTSWEHVKKDFPKGTKYIAFEFSAGTAGFVMDEFLFSVSAAPAPYNIALTGLTDVSATLCWSPPGTEATVTGYVWQYKKDSESSWSNEGTTTNNSVDLSDLSDCTAYNFQVKAVYSDGEESLWQSFSFKTSMSLPYECGFENNGDIDKWTMKNHNVGYTTVCSIDEVYGKSHAGKKSFLFQCLYENKHNQYLISPQFGGTDPITVTFYYRIGQVVFPETFQVGYSKSDDADSRDPASAFIWEDNVEVGDGQWHLYEHNFPAGTRYIAIKYKTNAEYLYLDDFIFTEASSIARPTGLAASRFTSQGATITWTAPSGATAYAYQYRKAGENNWSGEIQVNTNSVPLTGLAANTAYDFRVKASNGSDASSYSLPLQFKTDGKVESLPFFDGLGDYNAPDIGIWRIVDGIGDSGLGSRSETSESIQDLGNWIVLAGGTAQTQYLMSPELSVGKSVVLSFIYAGINEDNLPEKKVSLWVGWSFTDREKESFTWNEQALIATTEPQQYLMTLPAGIKYFAIKKTGVKHAYLDDIGIIDAERFDLQASSASLNGEDKYVTTFYSQYCPFKLPQNARAYTATLDGDEVVLHQVGNDGSIIPRSTGVVVVADKMPGDDGETKNLVMVPLLSTDVVAPEGNILLGSDIQVIALDGKVSGHYVYVQGVKNGKLGFYRFNESCESIGCRKAFLQTSMAEGSTYGYIVRGATAKGDANGDEKVNVADIVRLVKDKAPKADIDAVVKIIMGR